MMKIFISRFSKLAAAALGFKVQAFVPALLALTCLLAAVPASAQVNYAISGDTAYVASSPNATGDIVIAATFNGYPVTSIRGNAFMRCTNLTGVTIPYSVTSIASFAFTNCTKLTSVTIPNSVASIGAYAFSFCTSLTNVIIGNSVTNIGYLPFDMCFRLTNLSVDAANPAYSSFNGALFDKAQTILITVPPSHHSYVIPDSVITIEDRAFFFSTSLTNVIIGNSVTRIGSTAFSQCWNLTSVTIGNSVTNIGDQAFWECGRLRRVTIPNSVTSIERDAFTGCGNLKNFTFLGNAPQLTGFDGRTFPNAALGAKVYYSCGTTGWGATYGGLPTVMLCPPQIAPGGAGMKPGGFGFTLNRLTNETIVVEVSTNLTNWQPIWTNTLPGASADFVDPEWLNHSNRYYRARSE